MLLILRSAGEIAKLTVVLLLFKCNSLDLICNEGIVAELGRDAGLTCSFQRPTAIYYDSPKVSNVAYCIHNRVCRSTNILYSITTLDHNTTTLNIRNASRSDAGIWTCKDVNTARSSTCNLVVMKTPSCTITSDSNTDDIELNEELTITVNLRNYYCSQSFDILLQSGDTTKELATDLSVDKVHTDMFNSIFKVSDSNIGSVKLLFSCNNKSIPCSGVSRVLRKPPFCKILSNSNSEELEVFETITLSVYVDGYSCSRNLKYALSIGDVMEPLKQSDNGIYLGTTTIILTDSHFGFVYVDFTCNNFTRKIVCEGITILSRKTSLLIQGFSLGIGIGIGIVIMFLLMGLYFVVKRKRSRSTGGVEASQSEMRSVGHPEAEDRQESVLHNEGAEHVVRSDYDDLHRNVATVNTYDILTSYQNI